MALTDDLCEVHKILNVISIGMNSKRCVDGSKWSEHKKQKQLMHFECKRRDVSRALTYFKYTYPHEMTTVQARNPLDKSAILSLW